MRNLVFRTNRIGREMDSLLNGCMVHSHDLETDEPRFAPRVNITEDTDNFFLTFELPGMDKGNIKVVVQDDNLTVSGERKFEREESGDGFIRSEIRTGSFSRSFNLPDNIDAEKVKADYNNGLLEVSIAKAEEKKPKEIEVKIS
ncbi:MAG: Hsp20/alpha crystallin family protein [bacterium]|nr:Hsp20/alpha crystallin family protein [bacterium]